MTPGQLTIGAFSGFSMDNISSSSLSGSNVSQAELFPPNSVITAVLTNLDNSPILSAMPGLV